LSMHHREKLKLSFIFVLHSYTHIKYARREYLINTFVAEETHDPPADPRLIPAFTNR
jgi:hypothetical protein